MKKNIEGFLIIEALLGIVILSVVFLTLFSTLAFLTNKTARSSFDTEASSVLQSGMEQTRSVLLASWGPTIVGHYYPVFNADSNNWNLNAGDEGLLEGRFTRTIVISEVCRDLRNEGVQVSCTTGLIDPQSKLIKVSVSWNESGTTKSATASLLVFKGKI